jgi:hypothetical protein
MENKHYRSIKSAASLAAILTLAFFQPACSTLTASQRSALLVSAETLANIAGTAAATYYGGSAAGQLASDGLSALAGVLQGYVGTTVPANIVQATPGVAGVGPAVVNVIAPDKKVTQADVNAVSAAAKIAQSLPAPATSGTAPATTP